MLRPGYLYKVSSFGISFIILFLIFNLQPPSDEIPLDVSAQDETVHMSMDPLSSGPTCRRKNVLLLIADDLRPQLSSYRGEDYPDPSQNQDIFTPNLDYLAKKSLLLKRAYAQWSSCGPSRASFLTSRRPQTTKVWDLHSNWRHTGGNFTSLPQLFKEHGYMTAGVGKVFHPIDGPEENDPISWTVPFYQPPNLAHWSWVSTVGVSWKGVSKEERNQMPLEDEQTTDHALKLLTELAPAAKTCDEHFFMAVGFHKPHLPFVVPEEFLHLYPLSSVHPPSNPYAPLDMPDLAWDDFIELRRYLDIKKLHNRGHINETLPSHTSRQLRRAYFASVSYVDYLIGEILKQLKILNLEESTIVTFMGDHGFSLGENGEWAKHNNFEQTLHVPMMVHIPGKTDHGIESRNIVELVDLFPTLSEAAGLGTIPPCPDISTNINVCTEGKTLLPLLNNPDVDLSQAAFSQHKRNDLRMGYTVRTDRFRYTEWIQISRTWSSFERWDFHNNWDDRLGIELYDHVIDPLENVNVAYDLLFQEVCADLSSVLHKHFRTIIYDFPRNTKTLFADY